MLDAQKKIEEWVFYVVALIACHVFQHVGTMLAMMQFYCCLLLTPSAKDAYCVKPE